MSATITLPSVKLCKCEGCSNAAISFDGRCKEHITYHSLKRYNSRPKAGIRMKDPIGIELEMYNRESIRYITAISRFVCTDGSLNANGAEVKSVAPANKVLKVGADIAQRSKLAGNYVDNKCGFHVHCSLPNGFTRASTWKHPEAVVVTRYFTNETEEDNVRYNNILWQFVSGIQDYFFDLVPEHRRKSVFCKQLTSLRDMFQHYSWLSLSEKIPTVEVRLHPGTVNPWKVMGWLDVCIQLRSVIHKILGQKMTMDEVEMYKGAKFSDFMPDGIGKRYLLAREKNCVLTSFGPSQVD